MGQAIPRATCTTPRAASRATSRPSRGSFLHTLVIAWSHSKVTSASALFCHKRLHSPEELSLAPGAEASKYRRTMVEHVQVYLFHGLSVFLLFNNWRLAPLQGW